MRILTCLLLFMLFIVSCRQKQPAAIIPKAKMELILWDFLRADVYTFQYLKKDSLTNDTLANIALQNKIFRNYKTSREEFKRSYEYYINRPEEMNAILDSIVSRQSRNSQQGKIKEQKQYE